MSWSFQPIPSASTGANIYSITVDNGAFTLSGQAVGLKRALRLDAAVGSFTLSGQAVNFPRALKLLATNGAFVLSGQVAALKRAIILPVAHGAFTLSGQAITVTQGRGVAADVGAFVLSGQAVGFVRALRLSAAHGVFTLSGQDVAFISGVGLTADVGAIALSGQDVTFSRGYSVGAGVGSFALHGQAASIIASVATVIGAGLRFYTQRATYWPRSADDGFGGWTYGSPVRYAVRWEEWVEERFDEKGDPFISRALVWLPEVVLTGGYLYLGQIVAADPTILDEAFVIRQVVNTPSIRGDAKEVRAYL